LDDKEAFKWFVSAAMQGHKLAHAEIGNIPIRIVDVQQEFNKLAKKEY